MEQELEAHTDIWGRNSKEALVALDAACFIFFFCAASFTARRKRTNKREKISILIPTHSGPWPVHHVIEKMLMLAAIIFLR